MGAGNRGNYLPNHNYYSRLNTDLILHPKGFAIYYNSRPYIEKCSVRVRHTWICKNLIF